MSQRIPKVGEVFAGYRIESELGRGGMGVVYLAEHVHLERKVALKLLAAELTDDDNFRQRFIRESKAAAALDHANIIPIFDAGEIGGLLYLTMRYAQGRDLKEVLLAEGALEPQRALGLLEQAGKALDTAHVQGLVHRDVKPQNMLVTGRGSSEHLYLLDFGLTKKLTQSSGLTMAGTFMGTVDYVSPEQIEGRKVDHRTDIYSLGCVLYECLSGRVPYDRDSEMSVIHAHITAEPPPLSRVMPELGAFDAVITKAMAKYPRDRYGSCWELVQAGSGALEAAAADATPAAPATGPTVIGPTQPWGGSQEQQPSYPPQQPQPSYPPPPQQEQPSWPPPQQPQPQPQPQPSYPPPQQQQQPSWPPPQQPQPQPSYPPPQQWAPQQPAQKPNRALMWGVIGGVALLLVVLGVIGAVLGDGDEPQVDPGAILVKTDLPERTLTEFAAADLKSLLPNRVNGIPEFQNLEVFCVTPGIDGKVGHDFVSADDIVQLFLCLYPSEEMADQEFAATITEVESQGFSKRGEVQAVVDSEGNQIGQAQLLENPSATGVDPKEALVWTNGNLAVGATSQRNNQLEDVFADLEF